MKTLKAWFGNDGENPGDHEPVAFRDDGSKVARAEWNGGPGGEAEEVAATVVNGVLSLSVRVAGKSCLVWAGGVVAPATLELRVPDGRRLNIELR